jgi:hypothetical protein
MEQKLRFKAVIEIRGASNQLLYSECKPCIEKLAVHRLTAHEPGWASCQPVRITLFQKPALPGEDWKPYKTIPYELIPEEQQSWRKNVNTNC